MPTEFTLPELGENIAAGDVVRVLVSPGDTVAKDQPVLELETDKATIEVPSSVAGTVGEVRVKKGDKVKVGQVVLTIDRRRRACGCEGQEGGRRRHESRSRRRRLTLRPLPKPDGGDADDASPAAARGAAEREQGQGQTDAPETQAAPGAAEDAADAEEEAGRGRRDQPRRARTSGGACRTTSGRTRASGRAIGAAARARARRGHPPGAGQWPRRPHQRRGCPAVREGGAARVAERRPPPRRPRCRTSRSGVTSSGSR